MSDIQEKWETLHFTKTEETKRMRVGGGWIYRVETWDSSGPRLPVALVFVPDVDRIP